MSRRKHFGMVAGPKFIHEGEMQVCSGWGFKPRVRRMHRTSALRSW